MSAPPLDADFRIVPISVGLAEVRLGVGPRVESLGRVILANGLWCWQHRDGEQSSPVAETRTEAAAALAHYHTAFKAPKQRATRRTMLEPAAPGAPVRRLLFG